MSFVVAAALAVGAFLIVPALAHLLRRGRAREVKFPPAALVPAARSTARQKRRLEDRLLLAIRVLSVLVLAALGATPLVQCSRVSLARNAGASVALALVVDDSLSMRARLPSGATRYQRALEAAGELLSSTRPGDAIAIVLSGRPARIALASTTDLGAARRALAELVQSDRSTDLAAAVALGRAALADLPHRDKRVVVLSDLAGEALPEGNPAAWVPAPELAAGVHDCAVTSVNRLGRNVTAQVACTTPEAASGRSVLAVPLAGSGVEPVAEPRALPPKPDVSKALGQAPLTARAGLQVVSLQLAQDSEVALVLSGDDAIPHDDVAPASGGASALSVAVAADPTRASAKTGGPTLLEQALRALDADITVRPLSIVPQELAELAPHALLLLDDPSGLTPETRSALTAFVEQGGVTVAFIGPNAEAVQLGTTLEPFVKGALRWEAAEKVEGIDDTSLAWLGAEARSLEELSLRGRARLDGSDLAETTVLARFSDGKPALIERRLGRGLIYGVALPTSINESDLALRPGFLALLDHFLDEARRRTGPSRSPPGSEWNLPGREPRVLGPEGPLALRELGAHEKVATPTLRGAYRVSYDTTSQNRAVFVDPEEILSAPRQPPSQALRAAGQANARVDASREAALALVALLAIELMLRLVRYRSSRRASAAPV